MQILRTKDSFFSIKCRINRHSCQKVRTRCGFLRNMASFWSIKRRGDRHSCQNIDPRCRFWKKKLIFCTKIADLVGIPAKQIGLDAGFEVHEVKNLSKFQSASGPFFQKCASLVRFFEPDSLPKIPEKFGYKKKKYIFSFYMNVFFVKFCDFLTPQNRAPDGHLAKKGLFGNFYFPNFGDVFA